jgi:cob(I)alamin adenosyltransferase
MTASLPAGLGDRSAGHAHPARPVYGDQPMALNAVAPASASRPLRLLAQPEGLLQVHTAPYRGSFSAVLSQAIRSAGLGSQVLVCQFLKGGVNQGTATSPSLCGRLRWLRPAVEACLAEPAREHDPWVREAVREVWQFSCEQLLTAAVDLMVLDELGLAIELGFLPADEVLAVLEQRPAPMDVILTGPPMAPELMALADQVTQLRRGF